MLEKIGPGYILVIRGRRYFVRGRLQDKCILEPLDGGAPEILGIDILAGFQAEGSLEIERPRASPPVAAPRVDRAPAASAVTTP